MVFEQVNFGEMMRTLEAMGFYDVVFPFLLVFTILFAVLQKVKLFGSGPQTKNFNLVIAFVTAFFVLRVPSIVETINRFLPKVSLLVIVLLMFLLIFGIFGTSPEGYTGLPFFLALIFSLGGVLWAIADSLPGSSSWWPYWLRLTPSDKGILLAAGIFVVIIFLFKEKPTKSFWQKLYDDLSQPGHWGRKPPGGK